MAEINWPPDRTGMNDANIDELDFIGYHAKDDNNENGIRKLNLKKCQYEILKNIYIYYIYMKCQTLSIYYGLIISYFYLVLIYW
jgi:hypothetical protein